MTVKPENTAQGDVSSDSDLGACSIADDVSYAQSSNKLI